MSVSSSEYVCSQHAGQDPSVDVRKQAYDAFKAKFPNSWKQILIKHNKAHLYSGGTTTMSAHGRTFTKTCKVFKQMVRALSEVRDSLLHPNSRQIRMPHAMDWRWPFFLLVMVSTKTMALQRFIQQLG